jgi:hypothetical protein
MLHFLPLPGDWSALIKNFGIGLRKRWVPAELGHSQIQNRPLIKKPGSRPGYFREMWLGNQGAKSIILDWQHAYAIFQPQLCLFASRHCDKNRERVAMIGIEANVR